MKIHIPLRDYQIKAVTRALKSGIPDLPYVSRDSVEMAFDRIQEIVDANGHMPLLIICDSIGAISPGEEAPSSKRGEICPACKDFFSRFRCTGSLECDCPKCQGYCQCQDQE